MESSRPGYFKYLRLRHLTAILGRNFQLVESKKQKGNIFFALNLPNEDSIGYFYKSYSVPYNSNPTWETFDLNNYATKYQASKCVMISWFITHGKQHNRLVMEVELHFSGLYNLGLEIPHKLPTFADQENLVIFQFGDRYYIPNTKTRSSENELTYPIALEALPVKQSFSLQTLERLFSVLKAKTDTNNSIRRLKDSTETELFRRRTKNKLMWDLDDKRASIALLHNRIKIIRSHIESQENKLNNLRNKSQSIDKELMELMQTRADSLNYGEETKKKIAIMKSDHSRLYQGIINRKTYMIQELVTIYPINAIEQPASESVPATNKSSLQYSICNVPLPNCDLDGQMPKIDERHLGASLGMVAHVVFLISLVCDVPLRYPVRLNGSRSRIMDNIVPDLPDKERDFPLYLKTTTNVRHKYGLFLMNLNIITLRGFFGMQTNEPRFTLWNLKSLMEIRLRGRVKAAPTHGTSTNTSNNNRQAVESSEIRGEASESARSQVTANPNIPSYHSTPNLYNNGHNQTSLQSMPS